MSQSNDNNADTAKAKKPPVVRRKIGRPEILTDELQEDIVKAIRTGAYIETAAAMSGITKQTFYAWLKRGAKAKKQGVWNEETESLEGVDEEELKYVAFSDAIKVAQAEAEMRDVALIAKAAQTNWTAAAWRLERKFPDRWGRQERQLVDFKGEMGVVQRTVKDEHEYERAVGRFFGLPEEDIEQEDETEEEDDFDPSDFGA